MGFGVKCEMEVDERKKVKVQQAEEGKKGSRDGVRSERMWIVERQGR